MLIDWSSSFDARLERLEAQADAGRSDAQERLDIVLAQLHHLEELKEAPEADTRADQIITAFLHQKGEK